MTISARIYPIIFTLYLGGMFGVSCSSTSVQKNANPSNAQAESGKSASPDQQKDLLNVSPERISRSQYEVVLSKLVPIDGRILIGDKTITPEINLGEFESISPQLRDSFQERNKRPADITGSFDVYANVNIVKIEGPVNEFLTGAKKKFPHAIGLVLVSNVGITEKPSERIVYVEFYEFDGKRRSFLLVSRYDRVENRFNYEWIEL